MTRDASISVGKVTAGGECVRTRVRGRSERNWMRTQQREERKELVGVLTSVGCY